jgi:hypothetical protein
VHVAHGCGCASDDTIRWVVVALLGLAGTATFVARWWRQRRAGAAPAGASPTGSDVRAQVERAAPVTAGLLILGLALLVALVPMSSDAALLVLALGATVGTAGFGLASSRTRRESTTASP